jgi:hypothetical protein
METAYPVDIIDVSKVTNPELANRRTCSFPDKYEVVEITRVIADP